MSAGAQDRTSVSGPIAGIRMTEEAFRQIGRVAFEKVPKDGAIGGAREFAVG